MRRDKDGWHHIDRCQPPKRRAVKWEQPCKKTPKNKKGYKNMTTLTKPEVLVQVDGTYDPIIGQAVIIITEWIHDEGKWLDDGGFNQEDLNWWRELPEPMRQ